jgi:hypothetical protein
MIYRVFERIQNRPLFYLPQKSLSFLYYIFLGVDLAKSEYNILRDLEDKIFDGFQPWVAERFGEQSTISWAEIIKRNSEGEEHAFDKFFELLEEYKKTHTTTPET